MYLSFCDQNIQLPPENKPKSYKSIHRCKRSRHDPDSPGKARTSDLPIARLITVGRFSQLSHRGGDSAVEALVEHRGPKFLV